MTDYPITLPDTEEEAWADHCWKHPTKGVGHGEYEPPDYLNDLNAMHEAEKVLGEPKCYEYVDYLPSHYQGRTNFALAHATAAQRAEAFLRTLNLWEAQ